MAYRQGEAHLDEDWFDNNKLAIQLPHSCDNWIIGGVEEAKQLISDLTKLIEELNTKQD